MRRAAVKLGLVVAEGVVHRGPGVRRAEPEVLGLEAVDVEDAALRVRARAAEDGKEEPVHRVLQLVGGGDLALEVLFQVQEELLGLELVALREEAEVGGALRPQEAVEVEHRPRLGMRRKRKVDLARTHGRRERDLVPVLDARDIRGDVVAGQDVRGERGIAPRPLDAPPDKLEVAGIQGIDVRAHPVIQAEHEPQPPGVLGKTAVTELLQEEFPRLLPRLGGVVAHQPQRVIEPAICPFHDLGKPRVEKRVGRIQHRAPVKPPGGNGLGDHVPRRTIHRRLRAGEVGLRHGRCEIADVVLDVRVGINDGCLLDDPRNTVPCLSGICCLHDQKRYAGRNPSFNPGERE